VNVADTELIVRVIGTDDRDAFGELVQRHQSSVRRFLRYLTRGNAAWADDLAQETFIRAYQNLSRFRNEASFSTWLLGIAHNQFRNDRRKQRQSQTEDVSNELIASSISVESEAPHSDLKHDLDAALRQLSQDEQAALHLCYRQGLSHHEAASVLDSPIGTLKTHLARGKEKLRQYLSAWNPQT